MNQSYQVKNVAILLVTFYKYVRKQGDLVKNTNILICPSLRGILFSAVKLASGWLAVRWSSDFLILKRKGIFCVKKFRSSSAFKFSSSLLL